MSSRYFSIFSIRFLRRYLITVALIFIISGCYSTTTHTVGSGVVKWVPKVTEVAIVKRLTIKEAKNFRASREKVNECVFRSEVYDLYWADELKVDNVVLHAVDRKTFDVIKVRQIGSARISIFEGTRNDVPFKEVKVLNE